VNTPLDLKQRKNQSLDQLPGKHVKISKKKYTGNADKNEEISIRCKSPALKICQTTNSSKEVKTWAKFLNL